MAGDGAEHQVSPTDPGQIGAISAMLARAFFDDPVSCYVFPDADRRRRGLPRFFEIQLRTSYIDAGHVYTASGGAAAALWKPPGPVTQGLAGALRLLPVAPAVGARLPATLRLLAAIEKRHPREPHWYLGVLGTEPDRQGRGLGSAVLRPVLERCDAEGVPAYLESSKETNVPFYRRHGFEVTGEVHAPGGGPTLWLMWRPPR